jgi:hypothetical protein
MRYDLRREVRIANGTVARWREDVEKKNKEEEREREEWARGIQGIESRQIN